MPAARAKESIAAAGHERSAEFTKVLADPRTERSIADYDALFDPIRKARQAKSGKQLGDPDKLATAVPRLIESGNPPPQLLLGSDALKVVSDRVERLKQEIEAWESITVSTDG